MAKRQTVMMGFYRNEAHHLLDRLASALAAKEAVVAEARSWAKKVKHREGTIRQLKRQIDEKQKG